MTVHIENDRPELDFTMVPNRLIEDHTLSSPARMTLIYMCSRPRGYLLHIDELRSELGLGVHAWRRISAELRARGAMKVWPRRCRRTGRVLGTSHRITWDPWLAATESRKTDTSAQPVDKSTESRKNRRSVKDPCMDPNPTPQGSISDPLTREREKKARGRAPKSGAPRRDRNEPASRRQAIQEAAPTGATEIGRVLPSLERRRELALELGIDPDSADLWRLEGEAVGKVP